MGKAMFPTLLTKKATMFGSLTRFDLGVMGGMYLILSWINVSGLVAVGINAAILIAIKLVQKWVRPGFFKLFRSETRLEWSKEWRDLHE